MGPLVILAVIVGIFMLESKYVNNARSLNETFEMAQEVPSDKVNPATEGKPIYTFGQANTTDVLTDPIFGIGGPYIQFRRTAEMYQWVEKKDTKEEKQLGGGTKTTTTYSYEKKWSEEYHNSSEFKQQAGHENPQMPYKSEDMMATNVTLGAYKLNPDYISQVDDFKPVTLDETAMNGVPAEAKERTKVSGNGFYIGLDQNAPAIGDMKITFESVGATTVSVVGQQSAGLIVPYKAKAGKQTVQLLDLGQVPMEQMKETAVSENKMMVWIGRAVALLLIYIGFTMIFKPLVAVGNIIPFVGNIVGAGVGFVSFLLSFAITTTTIAIAWLTFRPLIAVPMIVAAVAAVVLVKQRGKQPQGAAQ